MRLRSHLLAALLGAALAAVGLAALADPPRGGYAPDPPTQSSRRQWSIDLVARAGKVTAERATSMTLDRPAETPRVMGRFAIELYIGRELLDRVRFDVPLMGAEVSAGNKNRRTRPRFEDNVTTHLSARISDNPRASYLLVVDRETGDTQKLEWPPQPDGRLVPWTSGLSDASPSDFPDGGTRAVGMRDGGPVEAGPGDAARD